MVDKYANVAAIRVTQDTVNVEKFQQMLTGISLGEGRGIIIDAIQYFPSVATISQLAAGTDILHAAVTVRNDITDFDDYTAQAITDKVSWGCIVSGTPASLIVKDLPIVHQFFPPVILAAPRLYCAVDSAGLSTAAVVDFRLYFRYVKLTPQEYIELAEAWVLT